MEVISMLQVRDRLSSFSSKFKLLLYALLFLILLSLPMLIRGAYYRHIVIFTLMYIMLAQAWNLIGGYAGQISLGNVVFFGIGAYTSTILLIRANITPWIGMWIGGIIAVAVSLALGYSVFRLKGHYFAMATLALGEITRISFTNWRFVGAAQGISLPLHIPSIYYMEWSNKIPYYYIILSMTVLTTIFVNRLDKSRFGFYAKAIKQDEIAARSRGISAFKLKQSAFALNAFITALAGTFYAQYILYISPEANLHMTNSILIVVIAIIGGCGTVLGPILGTIFVFPLTEFLRAQLGGQAMGLNYILFGAAAIFVVLVEPRGFVALKDRIKRAITLIIKSRGGIESGSAKG
mgnify:CR=1 FL=1